MIVVIVCAVTFREEKTHLTLIDRVCVCVCDHTERKEKHRIIET